MSGSSPSFISGNPSVVQFALPTPAGTLTIQSLAVRVEGPQGMLQDFTTVASPATGTPLSVPMSATLNTIGTPPAGGFPSYVIGEDDATANSQPWEQNPIPDPASASDDQTVQTSTPTREARVITLQVTMSDGSVQTLIFDYMLTLESELVIMANTFQTYAEALTYASMRPSLVAWQTASYETRVLALGQAFDRLARLRYNLWKDWSEYDYRSRAGYGMSFFGVVQDLIDYLPGDFMQLDADFLRCIKLAQVIEANDILTPNPVQFELDNNVLTKTTGDSSVTFRSQKPVRGSICYDARQVLGGYIDNKIRLCRV